MPVRQNPEGPAVPNVGDVKVSDHFDDLWKRIGIQQLIPSSGFSQCHMICTVKQKKNMVCKQCGIYYPSIVARKETNWLWARSAG